MAGHKAIIAFFCIYTINNLLPEMLKSSYKGNPKNLEGFNGEPREVQQRCYGGSGLMLERFKVQPMGVQRIT